MEAIPERYPHPSFAAEFNTIPSPTSVLSRLDQMDVRLKQLEEKQQSLTLLPPQDNYFTSDLRRAATATGSSQFPSQHRSSSSLSSALKEVHLKGTLMDRLRLLESRILQLSSELNKGGSSSTVATASMGAAATEETRWLLQPASSSSSSFDMNQEAVVFSSRRLFGGAKRFMTSEKIQGKKPKAKKVKEPKDVLDATEKKARDEKRRMARTRFYRKWFPVGC